MEQEKVKELVKIASFGNEDAIVRTSMEIGGKYTFNKISEPQTIGESQWVPVEDSEGHTINLTKLVRSKGLKWNSNKVSDRVDAVVKAVEDKGLTLEVANITERESRDRNRQPILDSEGKPVLTKVYTFKNKLVG